VEIVSYIVTALAAYLLGSLPTGFLVAKTKGVDIRTVGSKNMGATNVFRVLGKGPGTFVLLVDFLKGFLACWLLAKVSLNFFGASPGQEQEKLEWLAIVAGFAAILGHNYTCWLQFKGGKGVATTAGVLAAMFPGTFGIALALFLIVFGVSKYVSLGSIVAAASLPISTWLLGGSNRLIAVAFFMGALAIYKHKANIQRLLNGTENRFGKKKEEPAP
jgi:glycerol-3-phosphate acyltransferase PlsY